MRAMDQLTTILSGERNTSWAVQTWMK